MLRTVVVAEVAPSDGGIGRKMRRAGIGYLTAVAVGAHESMDIRLIVVQEHGCMVAVVGREMVPVPGRAPGMISHPADMGEDKGAHYEGGPYDIAGTKYIRCTDDFAAVVAVSGTLHYDRGDILIDVGTEEGLDKIDVVIPFNCLENAEIVDVAVIVEVEVGYGIRRAVEELFEFLGIGALGEERAYGLEVKMQRDIRIRRIDLGDKRGRIGPRRSYRCSIIRSSRSRCVGDDPGREATDAQERQDCEDKYSFHSHKYNNYPNTCKGRAIMKKYYLCIMKVLLINGSPRKEGNTATALAEMVRIFQSEGIGTEILQVGSLPIRGCMNCGFCWTNGRCCIDDAVNEAAEKFREADGLVVGSPVYYASPNGTLVSFLDRLFVSTSFDKTMKVGAAVVAARRAGTSSTFDQLNKYFTISGMPVASGNYWNNVFGGAPGEAASDEEGLQNARVLARNMAFLIKSIALGREKFGLPEKEKKIKTSFIR